MTASHAAWRAALVPRPAAKRATPAPWPVDPERPRAPGRLTWAALLRRVVALDLLTCPRGGGRRRVVGAVTQPHAVRRWLASLGLAAEPAPRAGVAAGAAP